MRISNLLINNLNPHHRNKLNSKMNNKSCLKVDILDFIYPDFSNIEIVQIIVK